MRYSVRKEHPTHCCCKLSCLLVRVSQPGNGHLNALTPVCILWCLCKCPPVVKPLAQIWHMCGLVFPSAGPVAPFLPFVGAGVDTEAELDVELDVEVEPERLVEMGGGGRACWSSECG